MQKELVATAEMIRNIGITPATLFFGQKHNIKKNNNKKKKPKQNSYKRIRTRNINVNK